MRYFLFIITFGLDVWLLIYNLNVKRIDVAAAIVIHATAAGTGRSTKDAEQGNIA